MSQHMITTAAKPGSCPGCRTPVLHGIAEGMPVRVEVEPLHPGGEVAALLAGAMTFTLSITKQLIHRDAGRIRGGHLRGPIHAQHMCKQQSLI